MGRKAAEQFDLDLINKMRSAEEAAQKAIGRIS